MKKYEKQDMLYADYQWNDYTETDSRIAGPLNDTEFTRNEGREVLYMVNSLMEEWDLHTIQAGQKIERMLRNYLPYNFTLQSEVKSWISYNWKQY